MTLSHAPKVERRRIGQTGLSIFLRKDGSENWLVD